MTAETSTIWDEAKQDALTRNTSKVRKKSKKRRAMNSNGESILKLPIAIMKLTVFLMTLYALFQYVPAFINFKKFITQTSAHSGAQSIVENRKKWGIAAPLRKYVKMNKAYLRAGQFLHVQYVLPERAEAILTIKQCKSAPLIEVFHCDVMAAEKITISNETVGTRRFAFEKSAMYLLQSDVLVDTDESFEIKWKRN